ncbi:MAG: hypothetical protein R6U19_07875, partial [Bacteroidales bacterium]
ITVSDFSEGAEAIDDDQGTIVDDAEVIMSNVRIANKRLEDVAMIVKKEQKPDIVIGDEGLKKFGSFTIDEEEDRLIFNDTSTSSPQED